MLLLSKSVPSGPCITRFHKPPALRSISLMVVVKPSGPHQLAICSGRDHASQTSSTGAFNVREISSSLSCVSEFLFSIFFFFKLFQIVFQSIQLVFPMLPVLINPGRYLAQFIQLHFANAIPALLFYGYQTAVGQHFYMQRYGLAGNIKFFGNSVYILRLRGNHVNDHPSGGIGYGLVYITSGYHNMQVNACKYIRKYLLAQIYFEILADVIGKEILRSEMGMGYDWFSTLFKKATSCSTAF